MLVNAAAALVAAATLSKILGKVLDITLVESEEIGTVGVGEATIPPLVTYLRMLNIKEQDFMAATQATFKLGISFENWKDVGHKYFHSFGTTGKDHWTAGFQHFWLKDRERGSTFDYGDYCLELVAASCQRLLGLDPFPVGGLLRVAVHVRVTLAHLALHPGYDGLRIERAALLGQDDLESDVEEQVAEFPTQFVIPSREDGVGYLVGLFEQVGPEAGGGLPSVPVAVVPQVPHQGETPAQSAISGAGPLQVLHAGPVGARNLLLRGHRPDILCRP